MLKKSHMLRMVIRPTAIALAIACVIGGTVWGLEYMKLRDAAVAKLRSIARVEAETKKNTVLDTFPDRGMVEAPRGHTFSASDWIAHEKEFYTKVLSAGRFDVLVIPVIPRDYTFDRATRAVLTGQLAIAIGEAQKVKVADPFIVANALGDGQRELNLDAVYKLANDVGAKRLVFTSIGRDAKRRMAVTIQILDGGPIPATRWTTPAKKVNFGNLAFDEDTPPMEVFEKVLPDAIKFIGGDPTKLSSSLSVNHLGAIRFPDSPTKICAGAENPACNAYALLLLARLVPRYRQITYDRLAAKAYLATLRLSPESPEWRSLRARADLALGYRPAAIKVLSVPQTDEERSVLALLNGNLPELRAAAMREENPLKRLLIQLDANAVAWTYSVATQKETLDMVASMHLPGSAWPYLVARASMDIDRWSQFSNLELKRLLDSEFPLKGYALEDLVRGSLALGDPEDVKTRVEMSVFNHGRKYIEGAAGTWCCRFSLAAPDTNDYMDLLQAIGHDNLIRKIRFMSETQARPGAALTYANSIEAVYKGDPYYTLARAEAEKRLSERSSGPTIESLMRSSAQDASNVVYWEQTQSRVSGAAVELYKAYLRTPYAMDLPYRPFYPESLDARHVAADAALRNSAWDIDPAQRLLFASTKIANDPKELEALRTAMEGRFIGSPERGAILAEIEVSRGDLKAAAGYYRESIQFSPRSWAAYSALGEILFTSGETSEAAKVYLSYPGFSKNADENRVDIANAAFEAGSRFFWSGHIELAKRFYDVAAGTNTGANAEMASSIRLNLLSGDYVSALGKSLERAKRYNEPYAYRDYLGLLHAMGQSKDAWAAFMVLAPELRKPQIWETALVGHQIAGASESDVANWVKQSAFQDLGSVRSMPAAYLLRFATTDRVPSRDLPTILDALDAATTVDSITHTVMRKAQDSIGYYMLGSVPPPPGGYAAPATPVVTHLRSDLAYFAEGYRGIKTGDFEAATVAFREAATHYDMRNAVTSYMLPYYALVAAKSGDTTGVQAILARFDAKDKKFDYHLAKAVIAAIGGNASDALAALTLARYNRPFTEDRPLLTQYTYGDICELLAAMSGNAQYRQLALAWAKSNEAVEPWHAWSYAMESRLTGATKDRQRAIAMLHYLDPKAVLLSELKQGEVSSAVKQFENSNPFVINVKHGNRTSSL